MIDPHGISIMDELVSTLTVEEVVRKLDSGRYELKGSKTLIADLLELPKASPVSPVPIASAWVEGNVIVLATTTDKRFRFEIGKTRFNASSNDVFTIDLVIEVPTQRPKKKGGGTEMVKTIGKVATFVKRKRAS